MHPIFHVSCLKKVIGDKIPTQTILSELNEEGKVILELLEYLIKWKNLPVANSTWEDENVIQKHPKLLKC